ncbi:YqhA family protein [Chloroflexia bacterium SDU3-3]|nr:YqhA family protein [Chloroflexia bacterium SDU3-3]
MVGRVVGASRYLLIVAVICLFAAALALLIFGAYETYHLLSALLTSAIASGEAKKLILACIELADLFLLATVLYITAAGLYELFIDDKLPLLPSWLVIHDLDDLKSKLIGVVVVVLGVLFLGQVVSWDGSRDLLGYGAAIALMIGALTYFLAQNHKHDEDKKAE